MFQENLQLIDCIYENFSIYQGIVIYDTERESAAREFSTLLKNNDYPVIFYGNTFKWRHGQLKKDMNKYRLFFVPVKWLLKFIFTWQQEFKNINFILFMDARVKRIYYDIIGKISLKTSNTTISVSI